MVYLKIINKVGWSHLKQKSFLFVFRNKFHHFVVASMTLFLIFVNLTNKTQAEQTEVFTGVDKPILIRLVAEEFSNVGEYEEIIKETNIQNTSVSAVRRQSYLDNLRAVRSQPAAVMFEEGQNDNSGSIAPKGQDKRDKIIYYTVNAGDTIGSIANQFNISAKTIFWENGLTERSLIRPGDTLAILPTNGISYKVKSGDTLFKIANLYKVDANEIRDFNSLSGDTLVLGFKLIIPGASPIASVSRSVSQNINNISNLSALRKIIDIGKTKVSVSSGMVWPTIGHRITQYYSWSHGGLDIANKIGTPIYAVADGTVEFSGWNSGGYGNLVIINHGGGKKTRYAHGSKLFVRRGEKIKQGDIIMAMGSTGRSTGSHLHFEIIVNGGRSNPLNYIK